MNPEEYVQLFRLGETHWWFIGTRDILFSQVERRLPGVNRILDVGCGSGLMMKRFSDSGATFGVDVSFEALKHCSSLGLSKLSRADTAQLPFKANAFDLAVAADLLEHCEEDERVLQELHRIITAKGRLLVSVPAYSALWSSHDAALHHKRRYSKSELVRKVLAAGFQVEHVTFYNTILFPPVALARLTAGKLSKPRIRYHENLRLLNTILLGVMRIERRLLKSCAFPFGLSLLMIASKAPRTC